MSNAELTERQQYWLDYIRAADDFDGTLVEYAKAEGLKFKDLYQRTLPLSRSGKRPARPWPRWCCRTGLESSSPAALIIKASKHWCLRRVNWGDSPTRRCDHSSVSSSRRYAQGHQRPGRHCRGRDGTDPFNAALFVFCNRARTIVKKVGWEGNGFSIWMKRLEKSRF